MLATESTEPRARARLRLALQHMAHRKGQSDRAEFRRIYQPMAGDTLVDGLLARGFAEQGGTGLLSVTDAGLRALADREWP